MSAGWKRMNDQPAGNQPDRLHEAFCRAAAAQAVALMEFMEGRDDEASTIEALNFIQLIRAGSAKEVK